MTQQQRGGKYKVFHLLEIINAEQLYLFKFF